MKDGIMFLQHLRPNGRVVPQWLVEPSTELVPAERWRQAFEASQRLMRRGYTLHSEVLRDEVTVSLTIEDEHGDVASRLVPNGPQVPEAVATLIIDFKEKIK